MSRRDDEIIERLRAVEKELRELKEKTQPVFVPYPQPYPVYPIYPQPCSPWPWYPNTTPWQIWTGNLTITAENDCSRLAALTGGCETVAMNS